MNGHTILIIEDDVDLRDALAMSLEDEGYTVVTAPHGRAGLEWLQENTAPCLILLDLWMPVMDGPAFRIALLGDRALSRIPVILVSATDCLDQRARQLGAQGFIRKPVSLSTLMQTVSTWCAPGAA